MSECTHDCSTCQENCGERQEQDLRAKLNPAASVKKGHCRRQRQGRRRQEPRYRPSCKQDAEPRISGGCSDADITGPSIPKSFGIHEHARGTEDMLIPCYSNKGTQIMSVNPYSRQLRPTPSFGAVLLLQALLLSSGATCCGMMLTTCLSICLPEQATFL